MRRAVRWLGASFAALLVTSATAQLSGETTRTGCIAVERPDAAVSATGHLTLRHMPGPPNYESIRHGDRDMLTLILVLPERALR
jgi:hypothetical protein